MPASIGKQPTRSQNHNAYGKYIFLNYHLLKLTISHRISRKGLYYLCKFEEGCFIYKGIIRQKPVKRIIKTFVIWPEMCVDPGSTVQTVYDPWSTLFANVSDQIQSLTDLL